MDRKETIKLLVSFKAKVNKKAPITEMILFGSRTRGKYHKDSDVDLTIVSPKFQDLNYFKRSSKMYKLWNYDLPVDFLCYTSEEFNKLKNKCQ